MFALEAPGIRHATGLRDDRDFMPQILHVMPDPLRLVFGVQTALQAGMMGGNARRTGILVALHRQGPGGRRAGPTG